MIYHVVPLAEWNAEPGRPYAPASLAEDGFVQRERGTQSVPRAAGRGAVRPETRRAGARTPRCGPQPAEYA
ncbi:hypothetical protein STENM36S_09008 [Streptomyces tendae]